MSPFKNCSAAVVVMVVLLGCAALPEWRVGQKKVDPKLGQKPPEQIEGERKGADYIEQKSAAPEPDTTGQLADIHEVAGLLSASLGEPEKPVTIEDQAKVIAALRKGLRSEQKKADGWKAFALKYGGKPIEGTGVDLAPWGGGLGLVAIVAACILVPGFGTFVLYVIRRLRGTVQQMAQGVEEFAIEHPEKAAELQEYLSSAMDKPMKAIVKREKKYLDHSNLQELQRRKAAATATP